MDESAFSSGSMYSSGEEEQLANEGLRLSRSVRWRERTRHHVTFEPALVLFCFAIALSEIQLNQQIIYQTCRVQGYERSDCLLVGIDDGNASAAVRPGVLQEIEAQVKPAAASVATVIVVIKSVVPAAGALLLGAWADRYGRKPVVLIAGCGLLLTYFTLTGLNYLSSFVQVNPWYYVLAYVPFSIPGGMPILGATIFAFIADLTNDQNRTVRMGLVTGAILIGTMAGSYCSRYVLELSSVTALFVLSTCCIAVGLAYIGLFVEDSIVPSADSELGSSLANLFSAGLVREIVQSGRRKRTRFVWAILLLVVVCCGLMELAAGSSLVGYKFTHRKFDWGRHQYGHFQLVDQSLVTLANLIGIPLLKKVFDWPDTLLALISIISYVIYAIWKGLAGSGWQLYLATGLTGFKGMEQAALLSICSYLLPSSEIAKFFGLSMAIVGLVPLASEALFAGFFEATVVSDPAAFNFLAAGIYGGAFLVLGFIQCLQNKRNQPQLIL